MLFRSTEYVGDFVAKIDGGLAEFFSNLVVVLHNWRLPTQGLLKPLMARDVAQPIVETMSINACNIAR